jgi:hypothetical protein
MKPQRFYQGQEVTLRFKPRRRRVNRRGVIDWVPEFGKVYKVDSYECSVIPGDNEWFIFLKDVPRNSFNESAFEPIVSSTVLEKELESITEKVKA